MSLKKVLALLLASVMVLGLVACGAKEKTSTPEPESKVEVQESKEEPKEEPKEESKEEKADEEEMYIAVISKGFQHQFWQVVHQGAQDAAEDYGVEITFDGPPSESDINIQVDMLKAAMAKKPNAVCLAALSTDAVLEEITEAMDKNIPIIGFDSGVPDAPEGAIYATASTDNEAAAAIAADELFGNEDFKAKLDAATTDTPIVVAVLSQDATSESIVSRTVGFIDKLVELVGDEHVEVKGHDKYKKAADAPKLIVQVNVPATTANNDQKSAADLLLSLDNLVAIYGSNENAAGGILAATNDGNDFNKENGRFKDVIAIGFDAGKTQRVAVENGWFYGSVTQDPYQIGYKAVELAVQAAKGEPASSPIVDTGAKWYNAELLEDESISQLVYE